MPNWINDAGTWKEVNQPWINDAGTWKEVQKGWINDAGTWKEYFTAADPPSVYFSQSFRSDTSSETITFNQPPNVEDLILILIEEETNSTDPSTLKSSDVDGYNIEVAYNSGANNQYVLWKYSDGTESNFTYDIPGVGNRGIISFIDPVNQTTPFDSVTTTDGSVNSVIISESNLLDTQRVVILFGSDNDGGDGPWEWGGGNYTPRIDRSGYALDGQAPTSSVTYFAADLVSGNYSADFNTRNGDPTHIKTVLIVNGG